MPVRRDRPASRSYVERTRAPRVCLRSRKGLSQRGVKGVLGRILWVHARREPAAKGPYCGARSRGNAGRRRLIGGPRWASGLSLDVEFANVLVFELCRKRNILQRREFQDLSRGTGVPAGLIANIEARFVPTITGCGLEPVSLSACTLRNGCTARGNAIPL
jgi:hypothetical protein